jgi:hypothetical protein
VTGALSGTDWDTFNGKQNALTLPLSSANGGTGVNNAGTLTNASNTTITGGGTLALAGFTLTVPATGTAALLATANVFTAAQKINANSTTALFVEQDGVKDNVFIVDTTNARVGVNAAPSVDLHVKGQAGIRIEGTGSNTNTIDIVPGVASSFDRLDFKAVTTNRGASFQLHPNGTATSAKLSMANTPSQTDFGSLFISAEGAVAYIGSQTNGSGTPIPKLLFGFAPSGGSNWTNVNFPGANVGFGTTSAATIHVFIENFSDEFGLIINGFSSQTNPLFLCRNSSNAQLASISSIGAALFRPLDAATTSITTALTVGHSSSGTPAAGYGSKTLFTLQSSTTADQNAAAIDVSWVVATHASRTARAVFNVYDTAAREAIRIEASGTAPMVSVYGVAAVARATNAGAAGAFVANTSGIVDNTATFGGYTIGQIAQALINFGILT